MFADDTALYASSWCPIKAHEYLETVTKEVLKFFKIWKLKINVEKTELILFTQKNLEQKLKKKKKTMPEFRLEGRVIERRATVKYLGVTLHTKLNYNTHIRNSIIKGFKIRGVLEPLISRKSKLSVKNKTILYTTIIRPILLYAAPLWSNTCYTNISKLQTFQNKIIREITKALPRDRNLDLHKYLNLPGIWDQIYKLTKNFFTNQMDLDELQEAKIIDEALLPFKTKYKIPLLALFKKD